MEIIDLCKNCATTECGHQFHSNCLMKSIAFNGFGCPYCRFEMVEEIIDSEDEEEYEDGEEREAGEHDNDADEDGDGDDDSATDDDNDDDDDDDEVAINPNEPLPSFELIQKKFIEKGITYESLVKTIMFNSMIYHKKENFEDYQKCNTFMEELFFDIVTRYEPEQEEEVVKLINDNNNDNEFNFYFLQDEYSQREYSRKMETALEKFLALDGNDNDNDYEYDNYENDDNENDIDSNILDMNSFINDSFLNNRFMEVV